MAFLKRKQLKQVVDLVGTKSDIYGHSGSGYGHSSSGYGHSGHSGYGHSSYGGYSGGYHDDCCPLVVDPLTLIALLSFLAAATFLLNEQITMSMLMMPGKKRKRREVAILEGRILETVDLETIEL